jgi:microcystin-dependent protein
MTEPYLSEIAIFSFNFAPKRWAPCNGQLLPINQNQALFSLLGTTYGGDGRVNFGLPNMGGRVPIGEGNGHNLGERAGTTAHTLNINEMPAHTHVVNAVNSSPNASAPANNSFAAQTGFSPYGTTPQAAMPDQVGSVVGGSQAHPNMSPFLCLNFCIALTGVYPSRN